MSWVPTCDAVVLSFDVYASAVRSFWLDRQRPQVPSNEGVNRIARACADGEVLVCGRTLPWLNVVLMRR